MEEHQDDETEKHPHRRNAVGLSASVPTPDPDRRLRMIVLGAPNVGKTQLVARFLGRQFSQAYLPTTEEFHRTKYMIRGRSYQLDILDTSGHTMSPVMQNLTLLTGDLFMVVYSVTEVMSWERAKDLVAIIEDATKDPERTNRNIERSFKNLIFRSAYQGDKFRNGIQEKSKSDRREAPIPIIVVGNKCDLEKTEVKEREVIEWLRQRPPCSTSKLDHFLASAKTDCNVQTMYNRLFAMSHLPCEFSPYMHRKVSAASYVTNNATTRQVYGSKKSTNPRTDNHRGFFHKKADKKGRRTSGSLWSDSDSETENTAGASSSPTEAIATVCPNQRRPSVDTEVLLAFAKVRAYAPESSDKKHDSNHASPLKKLKNKVLKLKFPSR